MNNEDQRKRWKDVMDIQGVKSSDSFHQLVPLVPSYPPSLKVSSILNSTNESSQFEFFFEV